MNQANPLLERITIDPEICHGKPCIRGLRYSVDMLGELLSAGMTTEEILADYPDLEADDIAAAALFSESFLKRPKPGIPLVFGKYKNSGRQPSTEADFESVEYRPSDANLDGEN